MKKEVVIIGGGPAGMMAAYQLQKAGIDYVLLEKNSLLGKKLLITGQGRCNVTNHLNPNQFIEQLTLPHKKFLYSSLTAFGTAEVVEFFEDNEVPLYKDGALKYFPKSNKAADIRDVFSNKIMKNVVLNTEVKKISLKEQFIVETNRQTFYTSKVVIATGSESYPKTGSTGKGISFANKFGIKTTEFYPAETAVYSSFVKRQKEFLQGIAIQKANVRIKNTKIAIVDDLLFTHFGLSGPSIFHLSETIYHELKNGNNVVEVSLTSTSEEKILNSFEEVSPKTHILKFLEQYTVKRLAKFLLQHLRLENIQLGMISQKQKELILDALFRFNIKIDSVEEVSKAFVNGGGVLVSELSPKSFECKSVKGLYFVGETVDLHGPIGGFNVTIALSSGYAASSHLIEIQ